jgi:ribulose-bisphosphate carboxylase large chain
MFETKEEVAENCEALKMDMCGLMPVLPVASGGLHPRLVPALMEFFGRDFVIQAGGGIHGHREGTIAGAKAMRQAVDATLKKIPLDEYSKKHRELREALRIWSQPA